MLGRMTDEFELAEPSTGRTILVEALAEIIGEGAKAYATQAGGDPGMAALVGGSAAGSVKALDAAAARLLAGRRRQRQVFIEEAERVSQLGFEELFARALSDEQTLDLFRRAIERAQWQADDRLVRFYARTATNGVIATNRDRVDVEARIFSTIARLDAADVRVLLHITDPESPNDWLVDVPPKDTRTHGNVLREAFPELDDVLDSIVPRLEGAGLVTTRGAGLSFGTSYAVTSFAQLCRARLLGQPAPPQPIA
jgi:hypothetical protein